MNSTEAMDLSKEQKPVILDSHPRILVSAGAGSGKTRLLVAYFVHALVDEGTPPERMIAVTFTRKAAAELVGRIRSELHRLGRHDLAWSLDAATVGTIHSLCRRLIKERALEAGVDPACNVLEADAAGLIKIEACQQAWESVIAEAGEAELEVFACGGENMRTEAVALYDRLRGMGRELPQIHVGSVADVGSITNEESARCRLVDAVRRALSASSQARPTASLRADVDKLQNCLAWLERPMAPAVREASLSETMDFFPSRRIRPLQEYFDPVRENLTQYRLVLAERRLQPLVDAMNRLLVEFHHEYETRKRGRGVVDFADLELCARSLVTMAGSSPESRPIWPGSRILIDEFQDTNELQCSILEGLGASSLLMVGDVRQSIYLFRGADVDVFQRREREIVTGASEDPEGTLYQLDVNYRSRSEILDFINRLFSHESFFGERFVPLRPYGRRGTSPEHESACMSPAVEILIAGRRLETNPEVSPISMQDAESVVAADRIQALVEDEGFHPRQIAVLLPSQTYVESYQRALLERGVEVYVVRGKGYYSLEEVADVVSLLRVLVNPHNDQALVGVLRSPLVGLSDDALYLLGRQRRGERTSLWEVVRTLCCGDLDAEDINLLTTFTERLAALRKRVGRPGLAGLIDEIMSLCDYDLHLLSSPEGRRRFANVRKLMRMADDFETLEGPDLAGFVGLLRSMGDLSDREGSAPTLAEGEDVVRVMTIHQAKGLEFDVVLVAGLGSDVFHGSVPAFVVDGSGRAGVFLKNSRHATYESCDLYLGPAAEIVENERVKDEEEDARLLYVAMTRAKDRLFLVGARPKTDDLGNGRIGRIVRGLGLDRMPVDGTSVTLEGHDVVITGIAPPSRDIGARRGGGKVATVVPNVTNDVALPQFTCPQFMEASPSIGAPRFISFSAIAAYQRCPRRFYLERMLGLVLSPAKTGCVNAGSPEGNAGAGAVLATNMSAGISMGWETGDLGGVLLDEEERHSGRDIGLLVHALLEGLSGGAPPTEEQLRVAAGEWLRETGTHMSPSDLHRALTLTLSFWDSPLIERLSDPAAEREVPFFFVHGELTISGVMDLLIRGEECWHIIDYKTNALDGRGPADLISSYTTQAVVYCLAALRAGAPAAQMDFVFLERPKEPQTSRFNREDIFQLEREVDGVIDALQRADYSPRVGEACGGCPLRETCDGMVHP